MTILSSLALAISLFGSPNASQEKAAINLQGTMMHTSLEGGCWYLEAKDKKHYELIGSEPAMQTVHVEGRFVNLMAKHAANRASICMVGQIMEITEILDTVQYPHDEPIFQRQIKGKVKRTKSGCWYVQMGKYQYELAPELIKRYGRKGATYNQYSRYRMGAGKCNMTGLLLGPGKNPYPKKTSSGANLKTADPR